MAWGSGSSAKLCPHGKVPKKCSKCKALCKHGKKPGKCKPCEVANRVNDSDSLYDSKGRNRNAIRYRTDGSRIWPGDKDW